MFEVIAFTCSEQLPLFSDSTSRDGDPVHIYPPALAGSLYPHGIPIFMESKLETLIKDEDIDTVVFAYSDTTHVFVMHRCSRILAAGANFSILGPKHTRIHCRLPVVSVCATRTGCGKSQTTRCVASILRNKFGKRVVIVRHPMPYGKVLEEQSVQRFASIEDFEKYGLTIEEMEEYEQHVNRGSVVYAGVDYAQIFAQAEREADIILWDGGNNDFPFVKSDLHIVVADPFRAGHERTYHPGETNVLMADVFVINKVDTASYESIQEIRDNLRELNPRATIVEAASPLTVDDPMEISGKRVIVVEDGPTLTHGEMEFGSGWLAARRFGANIIDPRPYAVGSIREAFEKHKKIGEVLPAMGYGSKQAKELQDTINKAVNEAAVEMLIVASPVDLGRIIKVDVPMKHVKYDLQAIGHPALEDVLDFMNQ